MIKYDLNFLCEDEKEAFVSECENDFKRRLIESVSSVAEDDKIKLVTLSGPTCSGKTTTADALVKEFAKRGRRVCIISADDYFRERSTLVEEARASGTPLDIDSVKAIDFDALSETVENIEMGKALRVPTFDFKKGSRVGYKKFDPSEFDVILFEGIQAVYPEVLALFGNIPYKSIFISVSDDVCVNGKEIISRQIRFLRRMVRDYRFRNTSPDTTFNVWRGVIANERRSIDPYSDNADVKINSFMKYEPFMLKVPVLELLGMIGKDNEFREKADEIAVLLSGLPPITPLYLPKDSVYREFLG